MFIRNKRVKSMICVLTGSLIFGIAAATSSAYLTSTDQKVKNVFTPGTLRANVEESGWEEHSGMHVLPGESRMKSPAAKNMGTLEAWMFLEVEIPIRKIAVVDSKTKRKLPEEETQIFTFEVNEGWELIQQERTESSMKYVYGYKELTAPLQETAPLFDRVTAVTYLEGSLDKQEKFIIPVTVKAIQKNIAPKGTTMKELYQIYLKEQEKEGIDL